MFCRINVSIRSGGFLELVNVPVVVIACYAISKYIEEPFPSKYITVIYWNVCHHNIHDAHMNPD